MLKHQTSVLLAILLLAGGLGYGLVRLFTLRLDEGDVYPIGSSLRTDPLGTKALFDALDQAPGLRTERNFRPLVQLPAERPMTLFYVGLSHQASWEPGELEHLEAMLRAGSRVVFAFRPADAEAPGKSTFPQPPSRQKKGAADARRKPSEGGGGQAAHKKGTAPPLPIAEEETGTPFAEAAKKWGFSFEVPTRAQGEEVPQAAERAGDSGLEPSLPWHSELFFNTAERSWKVLYTVKEQPVLMERSFGSGSIVLAADAFFLSNEALRLNTRAPRLLAYLVGTPHAVVFDEEHLGISEGSGVATLARKYRLHGLAAALSLLAGLFVWQNIVRFVPAREEEEQAVRGRSGQEGLHALLRRSVPAGQIVQACVAEWRRAFATDPLALARLDAALATSQKPPRHPAEIVAHYRALAEAVHAPRHSLLS